MTNKKKSGAAQRGRPGYVQAVQNLRRGSTTQRHTDRHAQRRKGHERRGGRSGAKAWFKIDKEE